MVLSFVYGKGPMRLSSAFEIYARAGHAGQQDLDRYHALHHDSRMEIDALVGAGGEWGTAHLAQEVGEMLAKFEAGGRPGDIFADFVAAGHLPAVALVAFQDLDDFSKSVMDATLSFGKHEGKWGDAGFRREICVRLKMACPSIPRQPVSTITVKIPCMLIVGPLALWAFGPSVCERLFAFHQHVAGLFSNLLANTSPSSTSCRRVMKAVSVWNGKVKQVRGESLSGIGEAKADFLVFSGGRTDKATKKGLLDLMETGSGLLLVLLEKAETQEEFDRIHTVVKEWNRHFHHQFDGLLEAMKD